MSNPRPCEWCGLPKALHWMVNACGCYEGVERTGPLRAKPVAVSAWTPRDGNWVPVWVLREFLDAERKRTAGAVRSRDYWNGRFDALAEVRARFCD